MRAEAGTTAGRWEQAKNVLCVRLDAVGDVLMTTPAFRALKQSVPERRLTLLTSRAGADIAPLISEIDDVIVYEAPWMKATTARTGSAADRAMVEKLRAGGFDGSVIFTVYSQNPLPAALLCYLADIPSRLAHCRENPYQLLTDWIRDPEPEKLVRHEVRRQLDLVAAVGCRAHDERLGLSVPTRSRRRVRRLLDERGLDATSFVAVHPGATAPSRRYPAEAFAEVVRGIALETGLPVVLTGSEAERSLVDEVRRASGIAAQSLAGALDLGELAALLERAEVLVSNNSAPVHLAAALGTPVVDLYALTNPQHTPWGVPCRVLFHDVPCKFCYKSVCPEGHHDCLRRVSPDLVVTSAVQLVEEARGEGGAGVWRGRASEMGHPLVL